MTQYVDFQGDGMSLFRTAWDQSEKFQRTRDNQAERDYQNFHAFLDMTNRDPVMANVAIPKLYSIIMTMVPRMVRAAVGQYPYIPFEAERKEFKEISRLQTKILNHLLYLARFKYEYTLKTMMSALYGTAFMEVRPYYDEDIQEIVVPETAETFDGVPQIIGIRTETVPIYRLRYKLDTFGPWEVKVDPNARGLEAADDCRYVIKQKICSRKDIIRLAEQGAYGKDFDANRLKREDTAFSASIEEHRGLQILRNVGLDVSEHDGDLGVLFRYESPDRYIDVWNDHIILRDGDNPYDKKQKRGHGLINLSRSVHNVDPHSQTRFWGNGEGKISEIMNALLNDLVNMALNNHMQGSIGKTYYASNRGISKEDLISAIGAKIPVNVNQNEDIRKLVVDDYGRPLPPDHYALRQVVEDFMDMTAGSYEVQRGEPVKGDHTLGEIERLREAGDSRQELTVSIEECLFLSDLGHKCLCHNRQWLKDDDKVELLGEEDAAMLYLSHPMDLPGSFNYAFTGSDRVMNQMLRQRNLMVLNQAFLNNPYINQQEWLRILGEAHEIGDEMEVLLPQSEEEMLQRQQQIQTASPLPANNMRIPTERQSTNPGVLEQQVNAYPPAVTQ